jgi:hypothetical protein
LLKANILDISLRVPIDISLHLNQCDRRNSPRGLTSFLSSMAIKVEPYSCPCTHGAYTSHRYLVSKVYHLQRRCVGVVACM